LAAGNGDHAYAWRKVLMKTVKDIMTEKPFQLTRRATVGAALDMLKAHPDIRHLPIIDDEELVGIVSERDLRSIVGYLSGLSKGKQKGEIYLQFSVDCVMTRNVVTVSPDDTILNVARLFGERKIGVLPVLDDGNLVGIVSYIDLLNRYLIPLMEAGLDASDNGAAQAKDANSDTSVPQTPCEQIALF
jgi:CBS domain-containing protein